jgi:hypothetical protein
MVHELETFQKLMCLHFLTSESHCGLPSDPTTVMCVFQEGLAQSVLDAHFVEHSIWLPFDFHGCPGPLCLFYLCMLGFFSPDSRFSSLLTLHTLFRCFQPVHGRTSLIPQLLQLDVCPEHRSVHSFSLYLLSALPITNNTVESTSCVCSFSSYVQIINQQTNDQIHMFVDWESHDGRIGVP